MSQTHKLVTKILPSSVPPLPLEDLPALLPALDLQPTAIPPQRDLSRTIDRHSQEKLLAESSDQRTEARLRSLTLPHAGDFLEVTPSQSLGLAMHPQDFRFAVQYRLGLPVYNTDSACPACGKLSDRLGDHAVGCGGDTERIARHDRIRDVVYNAAASAALGPRREVLTSRDSQARPADVYIPSWRRGKPTALDVTVISPLQHATIGQAAAVAGQALALAKRRKLARHHSECHGNGIIFSPLAVETLGGWDAEAVEHIDDIARFQSLRSSNPDARRHLWQRLGITLQRGNAALFARRRPTQPTYVDGLEER